MAAQGGGGGAQDRALIAAFQELDKELEVQTRPALKAALNNPDLKDDQKEKLHGFRGSLDLLRRAIQKDFGPTGFKQFQETLAKCRAYYEKFNEVNKLSDRRAEDLNNQVLPKK